MVEIYSEIGGDLRLDRRCNKIFHDIYTSQSAVLNRFCNSHGSNTGARRFLSNDNVDIRSLTNNSYQLCRQSGSGGHFLAIQDTTELNYESHSGRLDKSDKSLGPVGNNKDFGFFLHPTLVIDVERLFPIGFSSIIEWNRSWSKKAKRKETIKSYL